MSHSIIKWIEKAELIDNLCGFMKIKKVFLLCLTSKVFCVYQQLNEKEVECNFFGGIKNVMYTGVCSL